VTKTRWISTRVVVVTVIVAIHVALAVAFVPFVRVEVPAFVVTEVFLSLPDTSGARDAPAHEAPAK